MIREGEGEGLKYLNYFCYIDRLSQTDLEESQENKIKKILAHAYENTDYYHGMFEKIGFHPSRIKVKDEMLKIPLLTKDIVRRNFESLMARNLARSHVTEASTGGSTGVPMRFLRDRRSLFLRRGQELYFDRWMGYRIGTKVAYFVSGSHYDGRISQLKARVRNATCERMLSFDPHDITDEYLEKFLDAYLAFRPAMIKCFPNALTPFAGFVARARVNLPPVQAISCTGENLYAQQRGKFEHIFGGEVFEKVGTRESGVFACECKEHRGLHVFTEGIYLELLKENGEPAGPGEMGRVVITDLFNMAMPLIRYEIGDMAVAGNGTRCPCGSKLPLIDKLLGRDRDIVVDSYGNPKPGYLFVEAIKNMNLSAQIQVVQENPRLLVVRIAKQGMNENNPDALRDDFQKIVGPHVEIRFEYPNTIDRDPSGKFRYVISKVKYW